MWQLSMKFSVKLFTRGCVCRFLCPLSNTICRETLAKYLKVIAHKRAKEKLFALFYPLGLLLAPWGHESPPWSLIPRFIQLPSPLLPKEKEKEKETPKRVWKFFFFKARPHNSLSLTHRHKRVGRFGKHFFN